MPKFKNQIGRFQTIDAMLNRWKNSYVPTETLMDRCEVSERTIKEDIRQMRESWDAPNKYNRRHKGYHYTHPFEMPLELGLTLEDMNALELAVKTLNQFKHLSAFRGFDSLFSKIEQAVTFKLPHSEYEDHIYFEQVPFYFGTEFIEPLLNAIKESRVVTFTYNSYKSEFPREHSFHPYVLKEHTNRWYVIGWLSGVSSITTFALDRILPESLIVQDNYFHTKQAFNIITHFEHAVGMTVYPDQPIEEIILSFTSLQAKYFQSKPFHEFEIVNSKNESALLVKMHLVINYELIRIIVGMGSGVKVLQPLALIDQVKSYHLRALKQY